MVEERIEITKEQLLNLLASQLHKCDCVIEYYNLIELGGRGLVWSNDGIFQNEGIIYISKIYNDTDTDLTIKFWENEEDVPRKNLNKDNSDKVENIIISCKNIKFYLEYISYIGLKLIIDTINDSRKVEYNFSLKAELLQ